MMSQTGSETEINVLGEDGEAILTSEITEYNTQRAKRRCPTSSSEKSTEIETSQFQEIKAMIQQFMSTQNNRLDKLENHIMEIKAQNVKIESSNLEIERSVNFMGDQLSVLENKITTIEKERQKLVFQVATLETKQQLFERNLAKTSIEMRNTPKIPYENKENLFSMVMSLAKNLNMELQFSDIRDVYRLPSKKDSITSSVIIEFTNTLMKSRLLNKIKDYNSRNTTNKLNSTHIGLKVPKTAIYVCELLTQDAKKLYYQARTFAKNQHYEFCWTSEGQILLRQAKNSPYIVVKNEAQLTGLIPPNVS